MASNPLAELIDATPWIDTHEHLIEERHRLGSKPYRFVEMGRETVVVPLDWTGLLLDYVLDELVSAGLSDDTRRQVVEDQVSSGEKWRLLESRLSAVRATGYMRSLDVTTERLFGLHLTRGTYEEIDKRDRALRIKGFYAHVLHDVANVERCQVNSLDVDPFCVSAQPRLLQQDLSLVPLVLGRSDGAERASGIEVATLEDYLAVIEWCFERFGPEAVAVKCGWAYLRSLAVERVDEPPTRAFARLRAGMANAGERRQVEDFLFLRCLALATDYGLPVKLHLGHLASNRLEPLRWVPQHVTDVIPIIQSHPRTQFVLMHMAWPHHESLLSVAKHHPNVVVDLCWAWILAPLATREFVARFLTTVSSSKLLSFGGDMMMVENVVGHAELARRGLQGALEDLIASQWLTLDAALALVPGLMRGNAERLFPVPTLTRALK